MKKALTLAMMLISVTAFSQVGINAHPAHGNGTHKHAHKHHGGGPAITPVAPITYSTGTMTATGAVCAPAYTHSHGHHMHKHNKHMHKACKHMRKAHKHGHKHGCHGCGSCC